MTTDRYHILSAEIESPVVIISDKPDETGNVCISDALGHYWVVHAGRLTFISEPVYATIHAHRTPHTDLGIGAHLGVLQATPPPHGPYLSFRQIGPGEPVSITWHNVGQEDCQ